MGFLDDIRKRLFGTGGMDRHGGHQGGVTYTKA